MIPGFRFHPGLKTPLLWAPRRLPMRSSCTAARTSALRYLCCWAPFLLPQKAKPLDFAELIGGQFLKVLLVFIGLRWSLVCCAWSLIALPRHESSSKLHVTFGRTGRGLFSSKNLPDASWLHPWGWNTFHKPGLLLLLSVFLLCLFWHCVFWELSTAGCCPGDQFSHNPCAGECAEETVPPDPGGSGEVSPGWLFGGNLRSDPAPGHLSHLRWQSTRDHRES